MIEAVTENLDLILKNISLATGVSTILYLSRFFPFTTQTVEAETKSLSNEALGVAEDLSNEMKPSFQDFVNYNLIQRDVGEELDHVTLATNTIRRRLGSPTDPDIFLEYEEERMPVSVAILFKNGVTLRSYHGGFPLEVTIQSLYDAVSDTEGIDYSVAAYDHDLRIIRGFDERGGYDATNAGIVPKVVGYHDKLASILPLMEAEFQDATGLKILYIITNPIEGVKNQNHVRDKIQELEINRIVPVFLYISETEIELPLTRFYGVIQPDDLDNFPTLINNINRGIMETL